MCFIIIWLRDRDFTCVIIMVSAPKKKKETVSKKLSCRGMDMKISKLRSMTKMM